MLLQIDSVIEAHKLKSITFNAPHAEFDEIGKVLGSIESPTVTPLYKQGWVAVHTVVREDDQFWPLITKLKKLGCNGILVQPIERVIA
jgi:ATP phosphoribosyltransferase